MHQQYKNNVTQNKLEQLLSQAWSPLTAFCVEMEWVCS